MNEECGNNRKEFRIDSDQEIDLKHVDAGSWSLEGKEQGKEEGHHHGTSPHFVLRIQ